MELSSRSEIVWQISARSGKVSLVMGYAEGFVCIGRQIRLIEPFTGIPIHSGPGVLLCRGPWGHSKMITLGSHSVDPHPSEPWMALDAADLVRVHDLVSDLRIEFPSDGYRRDFNR